MQSNAMRAVVAVGSIAAIVVLFVVLSGGDDGGSGGSEVAQTTTTTTKEATSSGGGAAGGDKAKAKANKPAEPDFTEIEIEGGQVKGGVKDLSYDKGEEVRLAVDSDIPEEVHVHGYDITKDLKPGKTTKVDFAADIDGVFEIELEQSATQIAQLTVKP